MSLACAVGRKTRSCSVVCKVCSTQAPSVPRSILGAICFGARYHRDKMAPAGCGLDSGGILMFWKDKDTWHKVRRMILMGKPEKEYSAMS